MLCKNMLIIIYLILVSFVCAVPRRFNYNCFSSYAELFPVNKNTPMYSRPKVLLRGKDYDELLANLPKYKQKIMKTQLELANSIPKEYKKAMEEYLNFKDMLFARNSQADFTESEEDSFRERMKLREYFKRVGVEVKRSYSNVWSEDPVDWLNKSNFIYNYISRSISRNYIPSRLRPRKIYSKKDYCAQLADSLRNDDGWKQGTAKNAHILVFQCYDIFPYNDDASKKIFDLIVLTMDFYVFSNFTSNGVGAGMVYHKLKEQELQFDSSLHFHDYIGRTISRMNDAHISYDVDCYEQFTFVQPIFIKHLLYRTGGIGLFIAKVNKLELQEWVGAEVITIDGQEAAFMIFDYGDQLGKSHSGYSRYFLGLSRLFFESSSQDFRLDRGLYLVRTKIPSRSFVIYTLRKPGKLQEVQIKVDWMVFKNPTLAEFNDQYSYWDKHCEAKPFKRIVKDSTTTTTTTTLRDTTATLQKRSSGSLNPYIDNVKWRPLVQKRSDTTIYKPTIDGTIPIAIGPGFAFFILNDRVYRLYGVLVIRTFDAPDTKSWFQNMRIGFKTLMGYRITRLLLDLTGNSGGTLCLAYSLLGVLSPSDKYPFPATKFSYGTRAIPSDSLKRIASCVDEAKIKVSPFKLKCFTNLETRMEFPDGYNWGSEAEVRPKVIKGLIYGYTQFSPFLMDKCEMKSTYLLADINPEFLTIILVTDGLCGSSCAIVAAYLQQHGSPSILLTRQDVGLKPPNMYSFAGGQVINFDNVKDVARKSSCFDMIPDVLEKTRMTITYRAIFNINDKITPLEYYKLPAQYVFDYSSAYSSSYAARWVDFFVAGMAISKNPDPYTLKSSDPDLEDPYPCDTRDIFC